MIIAIPSVALVILLVLVAVLFLRAPVGNTRNLLITLINVILFAVIVYFILSLFNIV